MSLVFLGATLVQGTDVKEYGVLKGRQYTQNEAATPGDDWVFIWFNAYVQMTSAGAVSEASVTLPGWEAMPLPEGDDPLWLRFDVTPGATTPAEMNALFPNGDHVVAMTTTHDGSPNATLNLAGDSYPNTPTYLNFGALETVDPSKAFTVSWSAFSAGTANDFIQLRILNDEDGRQVFSTPALGAAGALNGAATSVVIPANTLPAETSFTAKLTFIKIVTLNTVSYPGAIGLAGYYKSTETTMITTSGGGTDTTPPELVSSIPFNGAVLVALTSPVVFLFDEAMAAHQSIAWTGVNGANFSYAWSSDQLTLTCTYASSLPASTTIGWTLNPSSQPLAFKDAAGNPLPADAYSGSFTTTSGGSTNCHLQDDGRGYGGVVKELNYVQTSAASPLPDPARPATFLGSMTSPTNNPVTAAQLQVPSGPLLTLTNLAGLSKAFVALEEYTSQSALDTARPQGTYNLRLTRNTSTPSANLTLTGEYPPTPHILNYPAAQLVNPSADFVVQWNGFAGATAQDTIGFSITHPTSGWFWTAPDPCVPRTLANTATSVTIPAGTLQSGVTYNASLVYSRLTDYQTNTIPDIVLSAFLRKTVHFTLKTTGGSNGSGPRFIHWLKTGDNLELQLQATAGQTFEIQSSPDLIEWNLYSIQVIPAGGVATFTVPINGTAEFFRAKKLF